MGGKRARHDSDWREGLVGVERKRANKKATKGSRRMGKCRRSVKEWQKSSSVAVYNTFKQTLQPVYKQRFETTDVQEYH